MYNEEPAISILRKLNNLFPTPTSSDDLWEFQVQGFKDQPKTTWLDAIDALIKLGCVTGAQLRDGPRLSNAANLTITAAGREELRKAHTEQAPVIHSKSESKLIFLGHAARDQDIAIHLKKVIETAIEGCDVFVSSDTEDLRPGDEWVNRIRKNFGKAKMMLFLASDRGLSRPWVWYETGSAWSREIRMIPCCLGKVRKSQLSPPFSSYQAINADESADFKGLLTEIGRELGIQIKLPLVVSIVSQL